MFDYAILQIVFALFLLSIPMGFATAIGWCDPTEYRNRPVLLFVSLIFTAFGVFGIVVLTGICLDHLSPGQNIIDSATGLFNAIYEMIVENDMIRFAEDQIHALVFSGVAIVFTAMAFIMSIIFSYVLFFRIALIIDRKLKNGVRYILMAVCVVLAVLVGVITSQYAVMCAAIAYILLSVAFLVFGNWRLMRSGNGGGDGVAEVAATTKKAKNKSDDDENYMEQEAKEFFGNTGTFNF